MLLRHFLGALKHCQLSPSAFPSVLDRQPPSRVSDPCRNQAAAHLCTLPCSVLAFFRVPRFAVQSLSSSGSAERMQVRGTLQTQLRRRAGETTAGSSPWSREATKSQRPGCWGRGGVERMSVVRHILI